MATDARPERRAAGGAQGDEDDQRLRLPSARRPGSAAGGNDDDPTIELGGQMLGPYLLVDKLGEGGMGVVHKAVDRGGDEVAVKVLRPHIAHDSDARDRLRREVDTLARVRHDHVAPVLDADVDGPTPYLVTAYVPGPPLDTVVRESGPLAPRELAVLGRDLAEALRAIHAAGVVHRDVKPGNVLMAHGEPYLIDFGIAHVADDVRLTMTGLVMGTPGYLSPEVVEGGPVTESTDWWGWAATLAFAASGASPFGKGPMPVILDRVTRGQADLSGVDERLRPLLEAALSPVPAQRPSAEQVLAQLQTYADGGHTTGIPTRAGTTPSATAAAPVVDRTQPQPAQQAAPAAAPAAARQTWTYPTEAPTAQPRPPRSWETTPAATTPVPAQTGPTAAGGAQGPPPVTPAGGAAPAGGPMPGTAAASQRHADPRIGQDARSGTLLALCVALAAVAALRPAIAVLLLVVWTVAARWVDRSMSAMVVRRFELGRRRSDAAVAVFSSPWHGFTAVISSLFSLLLPLVVGAVAVVVTAMGWSLATGRSATLENSVPWIVGVLLATWVLWWGPGGPSLRRGSRSMVRGALRSPPVTKIVVALLLLFAAFCFYSAFVRHGDAVNLAPFEGLFGWSLDDWLPRLTN